MDVVRHVGDPRFGLFYMQDDNFDDYLKEILNNIAKLKGADAQLVLRQFYETKFGVFDHIQNADQRPMSTVALYDTEENGQTSVLYSRIEQYIKSSILKHTGLNLTEFLSLPREIVQWIFKVSENQLRVEGESINAVQKQLNALNKADDK